MKQATEAFTRISGSRTNSPNIYTEPKKTPKSRSNVEKGEKSRRDHKTRDDVILRSQAQVLVRAPPPPLRPPGSGPLQEDPVLLEVGGHLDGT